MVLANDVAVKIVQDDVVSSLSIKQKLRFRKANYNKVANASRLLLQLILSDIGFATDEIESTSRLRWRLTDLCQTLTIHQSM